MSENSLADLLNSEPASSQDSIPSTASGNNVNGTAKAGPKTKTIRLNDGVLQSLAETIAGAMEIYSVVLNQKKCVKGKQDAHKSIAVLLCRANQHGHTIQHQTVKKWIDNGIQLGTAECARVTEISANGRSDDFTQKAHITAWGIVMQDYALMHRKNSGQPNESTAGSARYTKSLDLAKGATLQKDDGATIRKDRSDAVNEIDAAGANIAERKRKRAASTAAEKASEQEKLTGSNDFIQQQPHARDVERCGAILQK